MLAYFLSLALLAVASNGHEQDRRQQQTDDAGAQPSVRR